jgi:hypothetical protein
LLRTNFFTSLKAGIWRLLEIRILLDARFRGHFANVFSAKVVMH